MISKGKKTLRDVSELSEIEKNSIMNFLQGAVYCWCKNRKGEWFTMLDLMGGDNMTGVEHLWKFCIISIYRMVKLQEKHSIMLERKVVGF